MVEAETRKSPGLYGSPKDEVEKILLVSLTVSDNLLCAYPRRHEVRNMIAGHPGFDILCDPFTNPSLFVRNLTFAIDTLKASSDKVDTLRPLEQLLCIAAAARNSPLL